MKLAVLFALAWSVYAALVLRYSTSAIQTLPIFDASLALVLGLLMTIRTNKSYERWWEARTLWGTLVNASRNLAVKAAVYAQPEAVEARRLHRLISAFAYGLRDHLREGAKLSDLYVDESGSPVHVPSFLVRRMYEVFGGWAESARITQEELRMLDIEARILLEVCGGCERIRNTALPPTLTWITRAAVGISLILSPWFLIDDLGWSMLPIAGAAVFLLVVAETVAHAMEHPFGRDINQLDLTAICQAIDASTGEILAPMSDEIATASAAAGV